MEKWEKFDKKKRKLIRNFECKEIAGKMQWSDRSLNAKTQRHKKKQAGGLTAINGG
jgi:hypothetical protein